MKFNRKNIWKYLSNIALAAIILILFVPSWRIAFQGWFHGLFMGDIYLELQDPEPVPADVAKWELFNMNSELFVFNEFGDKPTILSFWATWCAYCRPELKEIRSIQEDYGDKINYISVSEENIEVIEKSGLNDDYDFLYFTPSIPAFFDVNSYPTLLILNNRQEIIYRQIGAGALNTEQNKSFFDQLISGDI